MESKHIIDLMVVKSVIGSKYTLHINDSGSEDGSSRAYLLIKENILIWFQLTSSSQISKHSSDIPIKSFIFVTSTQLLFFDSQICT